MVLFVIVSPFTDGWLILNSKKGGSKRMQDQKGESFLGLQRFQNDIDTIEKKYCQNFKDDPELCRQYTIREICDLYEEEERKHLGEWSDKDFSSESEDENLNKTYEEHVLNRLQMVKQGFERNNDRAHVPLDILCMETEITSPNLDRKAMNSNRDLSIDESQYSVLHNWQIQISNNLSVLVKGYRSKSSIAQFCTTAIKDRLQDDSRLLQTMNGSIYVLKGNIDVEGMKQQGFSQMLIHDFFHGFPNNWKEVIQRLCSNIGITPISPPKQLELLKTEQKRIPKIEQCLLEQTWVDRGNEASNQLPCHHLEKNHMHVKRERKEIFANAKKQNCYQLRSHTVDHNENKTNPRKSSTQIQHHDKSENGNRLQNLSKYDNDWLLQDFIEFDEKNKDENKNDKNGEWSPCVERFKVPNVTYCNQRWPQKDASRSPLNGLMSSWQLRNEQRAENIEENFSSENEEDKTSHNSKSAVMNLTGLKPEGIKKRNIVDSKFENSPYKNGKVDTKELRRKSTCVIDQCNRYNQEQPHGLTDSNISYSGLKKKGEKNDYRYQEKSFESEKEVSLPLIRSSRVQNKNQSVLPSSRIIKHQNIFNIDHEKRQREIKNSFQKDFTDIQGKYCHGRKSPIRTRSYLKTFGNLSNTGPSRKMQRKYEASKYLSSKSEENSLPKINTRQISNGDDLQLASPYKSKDRLAEYNSHQKMTQFSPKKNRFLRASLEKRTKKPFVAYKAERNVIQDHELYKSSCSTDSHVRRLSLKICKDRDKREDGTCEWNENEIEKLYVVMGQIRINQPHFWTLVSNYVGTRSPSSCQSKFEELKMPKMVNKKAKKMKIIGKKEVKHEDDSKTFERIVTARKGTLKRKHQIREFIDAQDQGYEDNILDSTSYRNQLKKIQLPFNPEEFLSHFNLDMLVDDDDDNDGDDEAVLSRSERLNSSTDSETNLLSPLIYRKADRERADTYIWKLQQRYKKRPFSKPECSKNKKRKVANVFQPSRKNYNSVDIFNKTNTSLYEDSNEEQDYYWEN